MNNRIGIVAGATGLVGGELLQELLIDPTWSKVYVLVRRPLEWSHPKLETILIDWDRFPALPAGITDAFCCLGTTISQAGSKENFRKVDYEYAVSYAKAAKNAGADSFHIVTALGSDPHSLIFYNRVKGEAEAEIRKIGFSSLGIFRPSLLDGDRKEFRLGEKIGQVLAILINPLLFGPIRKYRSIQGKTVAKAMLNLAWSGKKGTFLVESDRIQVLGTSSARSNLDSILG
ncbi:oxidoreductase [Leptospira wolffii]|uniref:Nucleoside-diphosphate sugar epimerase n=1 Tax=Leptospira wolffii TaxID=409998 RepID=A0A2M9ZD72_9LEPT|nr:oxidoreductase [Leptospira wolffii]PJZ66302.1 nucleoside-diphosphate sugar epimerase [Leptospira wolffii]TGK60144.1 oxidoreductase [Leptospira wolffii]TGK72486.1 oxidoreductase [Leptospira wolffii]TGK76151.1 oxidoreductase [Leptospira wolffii]TGL30403.1 oxidoreductase [Leptospira wolffii]